MKRALAMLLLTAACATTPPAAILQSGCAPPPIIDVPAGAMLRLLAVGDAGEGPEERGSHLATTIAAMRAVEDVDAMLLLGDNVYRCGVRGVDDPAWERVIEPLFEVGVPIYPVLGNHDWGEVGCRASDPMAQIRKSGTPGFDLWRFPAPAYVVRTGVAEIVFFDSTTIDVCPLRAALATPKTTRWRIVVAHHPLYSCGEHGNDRHTLRLREAVQPLLVESGVDLYVAGHDHDLELPQAPLASPAFLVSGSGSKIRRRGARCAEGGNFRIAGGFAVVDVREEELAIRVHCNGERAPCMERVIRQWEERRRPAG
jgi:tartrate-resistant acid phosphatase type 5